MRSASIVRCIYNHRAKIKPSKQTLKNISKLNRIKDSVIPLYHTSQKENLPYYIHPQNKAANKSVNNPISTLQSDLKTHLLDQKSIIKHLLLKNLVNNLIISL